MKKSAFTILIVLSTISLLFAQTGSSNKAMVPAYPCACEGNYVKLTLYYFGEEDVKISVFRDKQLERLVQKSETPLKKGYKFSIIAKYSSFGRLNSNTYLLLENDSKEEKVVVIRTSCPSPSWPGALEEQEILGKSFGGFIVLSHEDETGKICSIDDVEMDWHQQGNIVTKQSNKLGTRNNEAVVFITNDEHRGVISHDGRFGINKEKPEWGSYLDVEGAITSDVLIVKGNDDDFGMGTRGESIVDVRGILMADSINIKGGLYIDGNLKVHGDSVIVDHNLFVRDTIFSRSLYVKDEVGDIKDEDKDWTGGFVATFENTDTLNGDGISIVINREETTAENNFITFFRKHPDSTNQVVAGRIEGYHHNLLDEPAIVEWYKENFGTMEDFLKEVLGFETPINLNLEFINFTKGKFPKLNKGALPTLTIDAEWKGVDFDWNAGTLPSLKGGSLPKLDFDLPISFNGDVTEIIQPWQWFHPNWGKIIPQNKEDLENVDENPVFKLYAEAHENDWKSMLSLSLSQIPVKALELELEAIVKSEGITYGSKGADYAEWLPRSEKAQNLHLGQIVGVKGGHISLNTSDADQILVISCKPIILGNMPEIGLEHLYEKVAFMGQVPTWVKGEVELGDFVLASGENDGIGIAKSSDLICVEDIPNIVGKAWSSSDNPMLNLINVAIGIDRSDLSRAIITQQKKLQDLEKRLILIEQKMLDLELNQ